MHFCSKFGNCNFNWWWVMAWTSSKWSKFWLWSSIWPWRSWSIVPQNNRDLNQGLLHFWSKFGDPSWNGWWVIARTSSWLTHGRTHTQTDAGNDNTRRPKLASGKNNICKAIYRWPHICPSNPSNSLWPSDTIWHHRCGSPLIDSGTDWAPKTVNELMMSYCQFGPLLRNVSEILTKKTSALNIT